MRGFSLPGGTWVTTHGLSPKDEVALHNRLVAEETERQARSSRAQRQEGLAIDGIHFDASPALRLTSEQRRRATTTEHVNALCHNKPASMLVELDTKGDLPPWAVLEAVAKAAQVMVRYNLDTCSFSHVTPEGNTYFVADDTHLYVVENGETVPHMTE